MRKLALCLLPALAASIANAGPVITSITPNAGPVAGGTVVTIRGTGFSDNCIVCSPPFAVNPRVSFGSTDSPHVRFIDSTTLEATTPAHLPAAVAVSIHQVDGSEPFFFSNGFEFQGDPEDGFEPVLFPLLTRPVAGLFGSEFRTTALIANSASAGSNATYAYGQDLYCTTIDPPRGPYDPIVLLADQSEEGINSYCSEVQGRIIWIRKGDSLAANLRVADVSRDATIYGTEIPVVRTSEFRTGRILLLGVPADARFRNTLRIYSLARTLVLVNLSINGVGRQVYLQPGSDIFEPTMAVISDFPPLEDVDPAHFVNRVVILPGPVPLWAFITVTNNETQQITTITPQ